MRRSLKSVNNIGSITTIPEELETTSKSRTDGVGTEAKVCSMGIQR